jgi:hypothetical protein
VIGRARLFRGNSGQVVVPARIGTVTEAITRKCLSSMPGCDPVNAVVDDIQRGSAGLIDSATP